MLRDLLCLDIYCRCNYWKLACCDTIYSIYWLSHDIFHEIHFVIEDSMIDAIHTWFSCSLYRLFREEKSSWCTIFCYFILFFIFHCLFLVLCVDSACLILFSVPYVRSHDLYNKRHMSWSLFIFKWLIVLLILLLLSAIYVYAFFS